MKFSASSALAPSAGTSLSPSYFTGIFAVSRMKFADAGAYLPFESVMLIVYEPGAAFV